MESKSRRAPRSAGPIHEPAAPRKPVESPAAAAVPTNPVETVVTPAAEAAIDAVAEAAKVIAPADRAYLGRDVVAAFAQSQAALARGLEALSAEMAGLALSGIDTATRTATQMLAVKTSVRCDRGQCRLHVQQLGCSGRRFRDALAARRKARRRDLSAAFKAVRQRLDQDGAARSLNDAVLADF